MSNTWDQEGPTNKCDLGSYTPLKSNSLKQFPGLFVQLYRHSQGDYNTGKFSFKI